MLRKLKINRGTQGFTLIELMIVIAIIGILAAIAIPNFISYRNKSFCSRAESDANNIAAGLGDHFAIPSNVDLPAATFVDAFETGSGASKNIAGIAGNNPNLNITITVLDGSSRCPQDFQNSNVEWQANIFTKRMSL